LAIELAKRINGEIVSADSMQIYKDMNIGTAKVSKEEMQGIKHYMIDIISPDERYSVSSYKKQEEKCIDEILEKGKIPIVVGGTGLYINALIKGIEFKEEKIDEEYRNELNETAQKEGLEKLYEMAENIDPEAIEKISKNDKKRIIRILEIYKKTGRTKTEQNIASRKNEVKYDYRLFGITAETRDELYSRINKRLDLMMGQGLIEEVESIMTKYRKFPTAMQGLRI